MMQKVRTETIFSKKGHMEISYIIQPFDEKLKVFLLGNSGFAKVLTPNIFWDPEQRAEDKIQDVFYRINCGLFEKLGVGEILFPEQILPGQENIFALNQDGINVFNSKREQLSKVFEIRLQYYEKIILNLKILREPFDPRWDD